MVTGFVYKWTDSSTGMMYIGVHKGTPDDGYVCSQPKMLKEYKDRPEDFSREILFESIEYDECRKKEIELLKNVDAKANTCYYNMSNGTHHSFYQVGPRSRESIEKGRLKLLGHKKTEDWVNKINRNPEKIAKTAAKHRGTKRSPEARQKMADAKKNYVPWNKGKEGIYSNDALEKIGAMNRGKIWVHHKDTGKNLLVYRDSIPIDYIIGMKKQYKHVKFNVT